MQTQLEPVRLLATSAHAYAVRLARDSSEVRAAQALRFTVFNIELNEGLEELRATGLDADPFDVVCDHLLVEHRATGDIVGTYRLQTGSNAATHRGYYSEQEFDFAPKICGPPALDRQFKTIDFLTWLDLRSLPALVRARLALS